MDKNSVSVSLDFIDDLNEVANFSGSLVQAVECAHTAVCCQKVDPESYIDGTMAVLLLAAEYVYSGATALSNEVERKLEAERAESRRFVY